ncbi:MAG TPA: efflux RND transporter periplasmic adaptor subunit, partial [Deltaproteobacteria bacterium]|nr:efflux RND transporter periplasmic adaptor subunit [Deltaproteobacteria bacterium]
RETGKPRKGPGGTARTVWTIREKKLHPILIETGATDGTMTQVLKGGVQPGMALVVDAVRKKN